MLRETLNNSVSAEQRIFCPIRAVLKMGNTSSIPAFPKLSSEPKSSAVSSYLIIQSFLKRLEIDRTAVRHGIDSRAAFTEIWQHKNVFFAVIRLEIYIQL